MSESFEDQLSRVQQMADGSPTWDLSKNDTAALTAVLVNFNRRADRIQELAERVTTLEGERAEVLEKLKLALPHIAHELSCCQINSARDWATKGSVTTEGCACDRKAITTLIAKLEGTQGA